MIRGFGASKLGMGVEQTRTEVIANNLANLNTPGFKRSVAVSAEFQQMLLQRLDEGEPQRPEIGVLGNGATLDAVLAIGLPGDITATDRPLDFAIEGAGQFAVQGPAGTIGTRKGAFSLDQDGTLVTAEGYPVLIRNQVGELSSLQVQGSLQIEADGAVLVNGRPAGRLELLGADTTTRIRSGALENSNVELAKEMTDMIVALRSFQINQRALQIQDQTLGRATTEIGKV